MSYSAHIKLNYCKNNIYVFGDIMSKLYEQLKKQIETINVDGFEFIEKSRADGDYFELRYRGKKIGQLWARDPLGMLFTNFVTSEEKDSAISLSAKGKDSYQFGLGNERVYNYHSGYGHKYNIALASVEDAVPRILHVIEIAGGSKTGNGKYTHVQAVWIAAAVLSYETYYGSKASRNLNDYFFEQNQIRWKAQEYTAGEVHSPRVSQWCNGDHPEHTYCYLRERGTKRRLTIPGEFDYEKEEPSDVSKNDIIEVLGKTINIQRLYDFVHNEYSLLKGKDRDIDYISILDFIQKYSETAYSNPDACFDVVKKQQMIDLKTKGQYVHSIMKDIVAFCSANYNLKKCVPISWLDGSNTKIKKYLWAQMKYLKYEDSPISISIFVEKNGEQSTQLRVSLEIKNDGTDGEIMSRYHSHLDMALNTESGLTYVTGSNKWGRPAEIKESRKTLKEKVESNQLRKVQVCKIISRIDNETNEYYQDEICKAVESLLPYYEHVFEENIYWPSLDEYNPGITVEKWIELLRDTQIITNENLRMFKFILELGGESTCANIAETYGGTASSYNGLGRAFGERVHRKTGCPFCKDDTRERLYTIPFVGRSVIERGKERYSWKLRDELKEALELMDLSNLNYEMKEKEKFDKNLILYGPPGTGKTYNTAIYAVAICDGKSIEDLTDYDEVMTRYNELKAEHRVAFTTFHQSYGYEEFIEGIKPIVNEESGSVGYTIESGVFKKFCANASGMRNKAEKTDIVNDNSDSDDIELENDKNYVFIIDEINRGNISKIFGELITLIENTKREGMLEAANAILPYSGEIFSVPSNVYIIGTMNTADRSIALMDTALRRRFQFVEMMPDAKVLRDIGVDKLIIDGEMLDVAAMLETINERISFLYDREHTIGHAFFTGLSENRSIEKLASIFSKSVIPLLQEYFYEDYQKIQFVLGDNGKSDDSYKFIKDIRVVAKDIFKGRIDEVIDLPERKYEVNKEALLNIQSYIEIM